MYAKLSSGWLITLILFILTSAHLCPAVNTQQIDLVRSREILDDSDAAVIENFVAAAFAEFMSIRDFSGAASIRMTIVSRSSSEMESGQIQYGPRFFTAAQKQISQIADDIKAMPESKRKKLLGMNLMIIISDLGNIEVVRTALGFVDSDYLMTRYWAVNVFTNPELASQFNVNDSSVDEIIRTLKQISSQEDSAMIIQRLAAFASAVKHPGAIDIFNNLVDNRLELYRQWKVEDCFADEAIVGYLADKIDSEPQNKAQLGQKFALLYSAVIQRYLLGQKALTEDQTEAVKSVIAQSERNLTKLLGTWQPKFKRSVEKDSRDKLRSEHAELFGSASSAGVLSTALGFNYGKNADGSTKLSPPQLPEPPSDGENG